jgi:hypothetical protein
VSEKNNVNPDHYKIGGRDRPNETIPAGKRPRDEQDAETRERWQEREKEKSKEKAKAEK